ncbi:hypothetical protein HMI54_014971 [Coelomomyces lativittatus]|nr:hypothetical protein HMI56_006923 [Coelomomyces lativittatus]KAJ1513486.1 hypothetical protein HMI54_014971 [Coelomomyces lativittatus]KAJ1517053.1 hypothetical protein HMI55_000748 [Coelomomyces lativittatus]
MACFIKKKRTPPPPPTFTSPPTPFQVSVEDLMNLVLPNKNLLHYQSLGGTEGIATKLHVHLAHGLPHLPTLHSLQETTAPSNGTESDEDDDDDDNPQELFKTYPSPLAFGRASSQIQLQSVPSSSSTDSPKKTAVLNESLQGSSSTDLIAPNANEDAHKEHEEKVDIDERRLMKREWKLRQWYYGNNVLPQGKPKTFFQIAWLALQDKMLILLMIAACFMLAAGLYLKFDPPKNTPAEENEHGWVEGVATMIVVILVVLLNSSNDYKKEKQFHALYKLKEARDVAVVREGKKKVISIYDLVVGDILMLQPGDILSNDGVIVESQGLQCDESSATGESDAIKKNFDKDPFLISGSKILEGTGKCLVTSVGVNSYYGKTMMSLRTEVQSTPLQEKLNDLAESVAKIGLMGAIFMFLSLVIRYCIQQSLTGGKFRDSPVDGFQIFLDFLRMLITSIALVVVAVPEGLPLAVTLALSFATQKMAKENNFVRILASCEVMANATTVCSDKTGTLTQNKMTVVNAKFGLHHDVSLKKEPSFQHLRSSLNDSTLFHILNEGISVNSSAFEEVSESGLSMFVGSKTETALLEMQRKAGVNYETYRSTSKVVHMYPFSSATKWMGVILKPSPVSTTTKTTTYNSNNKSTTTTTTTSTLNPSSSPLSSPTPTTSTASSSSSPLPNYRFHVKGASEVILAQATHVYDALKHEVRVMSPTDREIYETCIDTFAKASLRTIGLAYKDLETLPKNYMTTSPFMDENEKEDGEKSPIKEIKEEQHEHIKEQRGEEGIVFLGLVGIEDPLREGVTEAVENCQKAGVFVRMVTGDNLVTARAIATQAGIYQPGGLVMEGPQFRKLSDVEFEKTLPRLQVLARSSPLDKLLLVQKLKDMGELVSVTGDGTNDAPAMKLADVAFCMGISGTQVAKEASSIVLLDDNFSSIVRALLWGRSVSDAVKKFLQFQLTVNVCAVVVTYFTSLIPKDGKEGGLFSVIELLWVNMIMDSLAALAYATEPPNEDVLLSRHPEPKSSVLIPFTMWKMLLGQGFFQVILLLSLHYAVPLSFYQKYNPNPTDTSDEHLNALGKTFLFNMFIFLQLTNQINCRSLTDEWRPIFQGWRHNYFFIGIVLGIIVVQVLLVQFGSSFSFGTIPISAELWFLSIAVGFMSIPLGIFLRVCVPTAWFAKLGWVQRWLPQERVFMTKERLQWHNAIHKVQTQLAVFRALRGDRVLASYQSMHSSTSSFRQHQPVLHEWKEAASKYTSGGPPSSSSFHAAHPAHESRSELLLPSSTS